MHSYYRDIGAYLKDTVGLNLVEDGAYNRLLDQYYLRELPLPLDHDELYRIARCRTATEKRAVDYVLKKFFDRAENGYTQKKCVECIAAFHSKSEKAKESAASRWERQRRRDANAMRSHSERNALAMRTGCEFDASHKPLIPTHPSDAPDRTQPPAKQTKNHSTPAEGRVGRVVLPGWLDPGAWADYVEHRRAKRAPMTDRAVQLAIDKLDVFRKRGEDPAAVIHQSIANGWTSLQTTLGRNTSKPSVVGGEAHITGQNAANFLRKLDDKRELPDAA